MLDRDTLEFVRSGLDRYPDARETLGFFEETIHKSIVDALRQREWRTFRPSTSNKGGLAISKAKGDTFLHAWLEGSTTRQGKVRFVYLGRPGCRRCRALGREMEEAPDETAEPAY